MTEEPNDGGNAFPYVNAVPDGRGGLIEPGSHGSVETGMSVRTWLTGQALAGMSIRDVGFSYRDGDVGIESLADCAVRVADAAIGRLLL